MSDKPQRHFWDVKVEHDLLNLLDPEKHFRAYVKHDGMVHIWLYEESTIAFDHDAGIADWELSSRSNDDYYWCVGDIDEVIARFQSLRARATQSFIERGQSVPEPTWLDIIWQEARGRQAKHSHSWSGWSANKPATPVPFLLTQGVRFFCTSHLCQEQAIALSADVSLDDDAPYWTFVDCPQCDTHYRVAWKRKHHATTEVERIDEVTP